MNEPQESFKLTFIIFLKYRGSLLVWVAADTWRIRAIPTPSPDCPVSTLSWCCRRLMLRPVAVPCLGPCFCTGRRGPCCSHPSSTARRLWGAPDRKTLCSQTLLIFIIKVFFFFFNLDAQRYFLASIYRTRCLCNLCSSRQKVFLYQQLLKVTSGTNICFVILCTVPTHIKVLILREGVIVLFVLNSVFPQTLFGRTLRLATKTKTSEEESPATPNSNFNESKWLSASKFSRLNL